MSPTPLTTPPPRYLLPSLLCSTGGFLFGMDTSIIGPTTLMHASLPSFQTPTPLLHGLVISSILIPAALSSFFAGRVADFLGRSRAISLGAVVFSVGAAGEAGAGDLKMFVVGRVIEGVGEGLFLGNMVVYITEIAPARKRGVLTSIPQFMNTVGLVVGFFTCYAARGVEGGMGWRVAFGLLAGCAGGFAAGSWVWLPESPRWLVGRGRREEAARVWDVLGVGSADREKVENEQEMGVVGGIGERSVEGVEEMKAGWLAAFAPDVRARTVLGVFAMGMQQMSGIDGILYYAPLLFERAGLSSSRASFLASGVSALVIMAATIPALIYAENWGRRHSTIGGGLVLSFIMFLIGSLYASSFVHETHGAGRWIVIASIYVFAVVFCTTWAMGIKTWVAESQPQRSRSSATNLAYGSNWLANFLVALTTPVLLDRSSSAAYFLFGGCTFVTAIVCMIWMPETKGKSLEEIEILFAKKTTGKRDLLKVLRRCL